MRRFRLGSRKCLWATVLTAGLFGPGTVLAQDFHLIAPDSLAVPGGETLITIVLDSSVASTTGGFSFGLCSDDTIVTATGIGPGSDLAMVNSGLGPDFFSPSFEVGGITIGCVISLLGGPSLPPDPDLQMIEITYTAVGVIGQTTDLMFCDNLGSPQVANVIVSEGASLVPVTNDGSIELVSIDATALTLVPDGPVIPGRSLNVEVELDNPVATQQFQFGVTTSSPLSITGASPSALISALNGGAGPDLFLVDLTPPGGSGVTVQCTFSTSPPTVEIPPGNDLPLVTLAMAVSAVAGPPCATVPIEFTDTLGSPPIVAEITGSLSGPIPPATHDAYPLIASYATDPPTGGVTLAAADRVFSPGAAAIVPITLDTDSPIRALSFGLSYDDTDLNLVSAELGATLSAVRCGAGPDFSIMTIHTNPPGVTFGALIAVSPPFTDLDLIPGSDQQILELEFTTEPQPTTPGTDLIFTSALGNPPVPLEVTIGVTAVTPTTVNGSILFGDGFIRGDCNADTSTNIADAIAALQFLFSGSVSISCSDACDANDDGGFDVADPISILGFLFAAGPPISEPSACGGDPTPDLLDCDAFTPCL